MNLEQNPVRQLAGLCKLYEEGNLQTAMSLNTDVWASSKRLVTSFKLSIIASILPKPFVILVASGCGAMVDIEFAG